MCGWLSPTPRSRGVRLEILYRPAPGEHRVFTRRPPVRSPVNRDRCGYSHNVSRFPDLGAACCWRPVWDDADRCVWHADAAEKPIEALAARAHARGERLNGAILRESAISGLDGLAGCTLVDADFTRADVSGTDFTEADLRKATFRGATARDGTFTRANLEDAVLRNVDLRGARLDRARLDEVEFTESRIDRETTFGDRSVYETRLARATTAEERRSLFGSATWTYRALQRLAHDNARRGQTYEYYHREMDLRRQFAWSEGYYLYALKAEVARWLTGYGHDPWRTLGASVLFIVAFAVAYPLTGGVEATADERAITYALAEPADAPRWWIASVLFKSLYFSVSTFATLGFGDFRPVGRWARMLAGVEALLGGLLMALLVVVLARRITWIG